MSFSSSRSSSESSSPPAPTKKKRKGESSDDDHDTEDTGNDDEDAQLLTPLDSTVLSHAEQRRQKKKQQKEQRAIASPRKKRKLDSGTADVAQSNVHVKTKAAPVAVDPSRQKRQNSVWVGNLAFRTTQDALRVFFDDVGKITRIHMPMRWGKQTPSENMGFAYVDFETPDAKVIAITLSEGRLDGRNLLIKDGDDFTGRPVKAKTDNTEADDGDDEKPVRKADGKGISKTAQKILRVQKQPPAPTLFLGNLGFETTEESIRELFVAHRHWGRKDQAEEHEADGVEGQNGKAKAKEVWIRKIRMGTFEDSGACKGFAFVDFTSVEHATSALTNPRNHRLNGRVLVVEYASPDAVRRGGGPRTARGSQGQKNKNGGTKKVSTKTKKRDLDAEQEDGADGVVEATTTASSKQSDRGHDRPHTRRAKPGAALARAQRQSAAILPGQGQKIVF